jgi:hypothetical protein
MVPSHVSRSDQQCLCLNYFCYAVLCLRCTQVAASVEDQLAAARASIIALNIERQQRERDIDKLQDAFRQMLTIRWAIKHGATVWVSRVHHLPVRWFRY